MRKRTCSCITNEGRGGSRAPSVLMGRPLKLTSGLVHPGIIGFSKKYLSIAMLSVLLNSDDIRCLQQTSPGCIWVFILLSSIHIVNVSSGVKLLFCSIYIQHEAEMEVS